MIRECDEDDASGKCKNFSGNPARSLASAPDLLRLMRYMAVHCPLIDHKTNQHPVPNQRRPHRFFVPPSIAWRKPMACLIWLASLGLSASALLPVLLLTLAPPGCHAQELNVVTFEYPPFASDDQGQVRGYGNEIFKLLNPNRAFQIAIHPLARARQELANGTFLIGMGTRQHHADAVKQGQILPVQVGVLRFVFFHSKQHLSKIPNHTTLEAFRPYRICAQYDSAATQTLQRAGITIDPSSDLASLFRKVGAGRCDLGLAIDVSIATQLMQEEHAADFGLIRFPVMEVQVDLLINAQMKDAAKLAHEWRVNTDKFIKDGSFQKAAERSFGPIAVPDGFLKFERKDDAP
jgi:ABC-type amino acid transport substrate-binding protein